MSHEEEPIMEVLSSSSRVKNKLANNKEPKVEIVDLVNEDSIDSFQQFKCDIDDAGATQAKTKTSVAKAEKENKRQPSIIATKLMVPITGVESGSTKRTGGNNATTKPANARSKAPRAPAKTKIEKEFEKLTDSEKQEFMSKMQCLYKPVAEPAAIATNTNAYGVSDNNHGATRDIPRVVSSASLPEEKELMKLRLELGDVLNRQADLKTKEKKLRLSIKKIQRKVTMATERVIYDIKRENLEDILSSLFPRYMIPNNNNDNDSMHLDGDRLSVMTCPLWMMAQQSNHTDRLCEQRRVSVERDATLSTLDDPPNSINERISSNSNSNSSSSVSQRLTSHTSVSPTDEHVDESSLFSQLIHAIDTPTISKQEEIGPQNDTLDEHKKFTMTDFANRWIEVLFQEDFLDNHGDLTDQDIVKTIISSCPVKKELVELTLRSIDSKTPQSGSASKFCAKILGWLNQLVVMVHELLSRTAMMDCDSLFSMISIMWVLVNEIADRMKADEVKSTHSSSMHCEAPPSEVETQQCTIAVKKRSIDQIGTNGCCTLPIESPLLETALKRCRSENGSELLIDLTSPHRPLSETESEVVPFQYELDTNEGLHGEDYLTSYVETNQSSVVNCHNVSGTTQDPEGIFAKFQRLTQLTENALSTGGNVSTSLVDPFLNIRVANESTEVNVGVVKSFLRLNLDLYQDILMYIPLNLDEVHRRMHEAGYRVAKEKLKSILDSLCIFQTVGYKR